MPITRLTSGATFTFTAGSGSTDSISFIGGTETPFNYVFRNGIVATVSNLSSASNGAYGIKDLTSINNQAELHNTGTYRYGFRQLATGSWDVSNSNVDKSKLIQNGSLFVVSGNETTTDITLPVNVPGLDGTIVKIINTNTSIACELFVRTYTSFGVRFVGANISGSTADVGSFIYTNKQYASIELLASSSCWIITSYTGTWEIV